MMEAPLWEKTKENAAPLERGRNVSILERSMATLDDSERQRSVRHYEGLVRPSEESPSLAEEESDPLIHWLSYIKYHQENFPSDTRTEFLLLERCFRALCPVKKYSNDQRFIRVCCMYAEKSQRAPDIFKYMHGQKIGSGVAVFWVAWAFVAERAKDFSFAEKVFEKGIRKKAQPLEYLLQRQKQFQRRMSRHWLNSTQQEDDDDEEGEASAPRNGSSRGVLGGISEDAFRRNDRSRRGGPSTSSRTFTIRNDSQTSSARANTAASSNGFAIYADDNEDNGCPLDDSFAHHDRVLERDQDLRKENTLNTERWNERGALANTSTYSVRKSAPRPAAPPAFAVYVDEECAAMNEVEEKKRQRHVELHRSVRDERTFREREHGDLAEKLTSDPLRYVRNPEQMELDRSRPAVSVPPVENKKKKVGARMAVERLLKSSSGREQCVDEARFKAKYFTLAPAATNVNIFRTSVPRDDEDSYMSIDVSMVSVENSQGSISVSSFRAFKAKSTRTPRNSSSASSTVDEQQAVGVPGGKDEQTINTQLALKELSMMFSSPAFTMGDDSHRVERSGGLGPILNESGVSEAATSSEHLDAISELASHCDPGSSFAAVDAENEGPRNPLARSIADPGTALQTLQESPIPTGGRLSCASQRRRAFGALAQDDPTRGLPETELHSEPGFQIYSDDSANIEEEEQRKAETTFAIFTDEPQADSQAENMIAPCRQAQVGFQIYDDYTDEKETDKQKPSSASFSIFTDSDAVDDKDKDAPLTVGEGSDGDTATLSVIGDLFEGLIEDSPKAAETPPPTRYLKEGEPQRHDTSASQAVMYKEFYTRNNEAAIQKIKASAANIFPNRERSLAKVLRGQLVCELQTHTLPRPFKSEKNLEGAALKVGRCTGLVKRELGRGMYGAVALLDGGEHEDIAIKVQCPAGCLAHEYNILRKVEERLKGDSIFPRALSFLYFADGALMGTTAASKTGINLIDLVNIYSKSSERMPEILALHYTARMLGHIEKLHWKGKILHCDVKPDNWVLLETSEKAKDPRQHSDIVLVDFGRAVDLTSVEEEYGSGENPMGSMLKGVACQKEMMCLAMRKGLPWSFDADTFGICASAHVLLFGSHLDIEETGSTRWMPKEQLRGYFQVKIWTVFFDTLLNLDDVTKHAIGSRPHSLRQLRSLIEVYIDKRQDRVTAALEHQAKLIAAADLKK